MTGRKTVQSSKGQILLGGGFGRIIIDPLARRIHEVARPSAERDRAIVCREFTWLLLIYYKPAGFAKDHTAATCLLCRRLRREKFSLPPPPPPSDRSGVSWNLLVTCCLKYTVTLLRNNVSRRFVDTTCRVRHDDKPLAIRESFEKRKSFASG